MEAHRIGSSESFPERVAWEDFYQNYRKPGYVPGFEIVNKLGGGMFGLVFKARKESIGKDYAIKFLKVDDETVRDAVARELESVRFFAQIDHPNLVSIEDKGIVDGIPFLVMSYAGQDTLQKRLQQGGLERDEALRIFAQAARGVQALHEHSLVHFDLKPANIFLKGDVARVGDYGLSKLVSESRNSLSFSRGTPYYMAPEMLQRRGDAQSDIYSLGIILFECLYGDVPFRGDSEWEVLRKHETQKPVFPSGSLPADRRIIERCLAKRPEDRFVSVAELLRALQAPVALGESLVFDSPPGAGANLVDASDPAMTVVPPLPVAERPYDGPLEPPPLPAASASTASGLADPNRSPDGMPWRDPGRASGPVGLLVRSIFGVFEAIIFLVMLPVRAVSAFFGRGIVWLLRLPFRLLGVAAQLIGLLFVAALVLLVVVTVWSLIGVV
ncbi:MAG: serine/threonine protein kinase [Planctomycetes bacterium]|nr:serine/threonine protein kinase [Planctomycetota bacterium]